MTNSLIIVTMKPPSSRQLVSKGSRKAKAKNKASSRTRSKKSKPASRSRRRKVKSGEKSKSLDVVHETNNKSGGSSIVDAATPPNNVDDNQHRDESEQRSLSSPQPSTSNIQVSTNHPSHKLSSLFSLLNKRLKTDKRRRYHHHRKNYSKFLKHHNISHRNGRTRRRALCRKAEAKLKLGNGKLSDDMDCVESPSRNGEKLEGADKENEAHVDDQFGHENIIDGFSFLSFRSECDLKREYEKRRQNYEAFRLQQQNNPLNDSASTPAAKVKREKRPKLATNTGGTPASNSASATPLSPDRTRAVKTENDGPINESVVSNETSPRPTSPGKEASTVVKSEAIEKVKHEHNTHHSPELTNKGPSYNMAALLAAASSVNNTQSKSQPGSSKLPFSPPAAAPPRATPNPFGVESMFAQSMSHLPGFPNPLANLIGNPNPNDHALFMSKFYELYQQKHAPNKPSETQQSAAMSNSQHYDSAHKYTKPNDELPSPFNPNKQAANQNKNTNFGQSHVSTPFGFNKPDMNSSDVLPPPHLLPSFGPHSLLPPLPPHLASFGAHSSSSIPHQTPLDFQNYYPPQFPNKQPNQSTKPNPPSSPLYPNPPLPKKTNSNGSYDFYSAAQKTNSGSSDKHGFPGLMSNSGRTSSDANLVGSSKKAAPKPDSRPSSIDPFSMIPPPSFPHPFSDSFNNEIIRRELDNKFLQSTSLARSGNSTPLDQQFLMMNQFLKTAHAANSPRFPFPPSSNPSPTFKTVAHKHEHQPQFDNSSKPKDAKANSQFKTSSNTPGFHSASSSSQHHLPPPLGFYNNGSLNESFGAPGLGIPPRFESPSMKPLKPPISPRPHHTPISPSKSPRPTSRTAGKWCAAHVKIAHMIAAHKSKQNQQYQQQQWPKSNQFTPPAANRTHNSIPKPTNKVPTERSHQTAPSKSTAVTTATTFFPPIQPNLSQAPTNHHHVHQSQFYPNSNNYKNPGSVSGANSSGGGSKPKPATRPKSPSLPFPPPPSNPSHSKIPPFSEDFLATEAAITQAAQQQLFFDKYRHEMMRLSGAANPPPHLPYPNLPSLPPQTSFNNPHPSGLPTGFPPLFPPILPPTSMLPSQSQPLNSNPMPFLQQFFDSTGKKPLLPPNMPPPLPPFAPANSRSRSGSPSSESKRIRYSSSANEFESASKPMTKVDEPSISPSSRRSHDEKPTHSPRRTPNPAIAVNPNGD